MNKLNYNGSLFTRAANKYEINNISNKYIKLIDSTTGKEERYNIEYWGRLINETALPYSGTTWEDLNKNLDFLHARLDFLRKTITYWDSFQIQGVVFSQTEIKKIYEMNPNSSLIVAVNNLRWNNRILMAGDTVIKDAYNNYHVIESNVTGIYKPELSYYDNNKFQIKYSPSKDLDALVDITQTTDAVTVNGSEVYYNIVGSCADNNYTLDGVIGITGADMVQAIDYATTNGIELYEVDGIYLCIQTNDLNTYIANKYYKFIRHIEVDEDEQEIKTYEWVESNLTGSALIEHNDETVTLSIKNLTADNKNFPPVIKFFSSRGEEFCLHHWMEYKDGEEFSWKICWSHKVPINYNFKVK